MGSGAITGYFDVAQITLYAFWLFFFGLIFYLRMEDKREGYPLDPDGGSDRGSFPPIPKPKTFILPHGGTFTAPRRNELPQPVLSAMPVPGMPFTPIGDPMQEGVGAASYGPYVRDGQTPHRAVAGSDGLLSGDRGCRSAWHAGGGFGGGADRRGK